MKKKLPVALLATTAALCCAFGFAACNDKTDDNTDVDDATQVETVSGTEGLEYTLSADGSYYCFTGLGNCTQKEIVIANYYNGKPVKQVGRFNYLTQEEALKAPEMAEIIQNQDSEALCIFAGSEVESVTISEGITTIGAFAFTSMSENDGDKNVYLKNVSIPDSVTSIGAAAFSSCTGLTSISLSDNLTTIGDSAFFDCTGLTSISITDNLTTIGKSAFSGCTGLTSINIPDNVTAIGNRAFSGCKGLTSLTIGNSVTSIGDSAFASCDGLTSITIPDSVTSIGDEAFTDCRGLKSLTIGSGVTSIGGYVIMGCEALREINYNGTLAQWNAIEKPVGNFIVYKVFCSDGYVEWYIC